VIFPDIGGVAAAADLERVIGALVTFVLVVAVLMTIVCSVSWALARNMGNSRTADRARTGVLVAVGAALAAGGMTAWLNTLTDIGSSL
jgi:steroid 5-alpha reductase family enzyme